MTATEPNGVAIGDQPTRARPSWRRELLLIAVVYGLYTLTRNTLPEHVAQARINALDVYHAEQHFHMDIEHGLNRILSASGAHPVAVFANYTYAISHVAVTLGVLVWLYLARPGAYRPARSILLLTTVLALLGFWLYPLAPPRLLPQLGFVDTVVHDGTWGSWSSTTVARISNQYAAMPSVHLAWSVWSAWMLVRWASCRWLTIAAVTYPPLVLFIIIGTANHWTLDALGGLAACAVGGLMWSVASRIRCRLAPGALG